MRVHLELESNQFIELSCQEGPVQYLVLLGNIQLHWIVTRILGNGLTQWSLRRPAAISNLDI